MKIAYQNLIHVSVIGMVLLLASAVSAEVVETINKTFEVTGRSSLRVRNVDGRTRIVSRVGSTVEVVATKEVNGAKNAADAKKAADRVEVRIEQFGNAIEVSVKYPKWGINFTSHPSVAVNFEISAPSESDIEASMVDGELEVQGFAGKIGLSAVDGATTASEVSGEVSISAVDGDIRAFKVSGTTEISLVDGDLFLESSSGRLSVHSIDGEIRVKDFQGDLESKSGDADQYLEGVFQSVNARSSDGDLEIRARSGSAVQNDWNISTSDGDLQLFLPTAFPANLEVKTGDGKINTSFPIEVSGRISERSVTGKISGGGNLLAIQTRDGDLTISQIPQ